MKKIIAILIIASILICAFIALPKILKRNDSTKNNAIKELEERTDTNEETNNNDVTFDSIINGNILKKY